jgi:3-methyladenine DNA glycosylase AlkD
MKKTPAYIAAHIRRVLLNGASAPHTEEVQRFFRDEIQSRGWYTHELRRVAVRLRKATLNDASLDFLLAVCDKLFRGRVLEEKVFAVLMLQGIVKDFGDGEFKLFASWLDRVSTWADHDALASYLLGPMIAASPPRVKAALAWAKSRDRWHRRAAAVALIRATRQQKCRREVIQISNLLLDDKDEMVQKGLGWLLREAAKYDPGFTIPYLMRIRTRTPRLVLRAACETLSPEQRAEILKTSPGKAATTGKTRN